MKNLNIRNNGFCEVGIENLSESLSKLQNLTSLNLELE
jgi:hypothetical protein